MSSSLAQADLPTLATAYVRYAAERREADFWAFDEVGTLLVGRRALGAENAWELVEAIIAAIPPEDGAVAGYVAAGPLEDVVRQHGAALLDWIEGRAARDPDFRWLLARIWLSEGDLPPEVLARIVTASGGAIKPLPAAGAHEA